MKRLLDSSGSPRAIALLEAGLHDAPSADAASRVALALGVAGAVTTVSTAGASGALANAPIALGGGKSAVASLVGKWLLIGAVGGAATSGAVVALQAPRTTSSVASPARDYPGPPARAAAESAAGRAAPTPERPAALPARAFSDVPSVQPAPRTVASQVAPRVPEPVPAVSAGSSSALPAGPSALGADVAMIDTARRAVGAGDSGRALEALDAYDREKRTQVLEREARLLRIDALVLAGRRRDALRLASDYVRTFPGDPHVARLRALVASGER